MFKGRVRSAYYDTIKTVPPPCHPFKRLLVHTQDHHLSLRNLPQINISSDILEFSSPDDAHFRVPSRQRKPLITKAKHKPKLKDPIDDKNVIEISSDEGEVPLSQECIVANLRHQIKSRTCVCLFCHLTYPLSP